MNKCTKRGIFYVYSRQLAFFDFGFFLIPRSNILNVWSQLNFLAGGGPRRKPMTS